MYEDGQQNEYQGRTPLADVVRGMYLDTEPCIQKTVCFMTKCLISMLPILMFCGECAANPEASAPAHPHRGHRWVRNHPYTIMGLTRMAPKPFDIKQYRAAGFTSLLTWEPSSYDVLLPQAAAEGLPWHLHLEHWGEEFANRPDSSEQTLGEGPATTRQRRKPGTLA